MNLTIQQTAEMRSARLQRYLIAFSVALGLTLLCAGVSSIWGWSAAGVLLLPGLLAAAFVFPTGINSNWPITYLVLAGFMNAALLAWPLLWLWTIMRRFHWSRHKLS